MNKAEAFIGHADILTPFGWGIQNQIDSILADKAAYAHFDKKTYGNDFPLKYAGHISEQLVDAEIHQTRSESILDQLLKRFLLQKKGIKIDAFFLLYKNINTFELHHKKINQNSFIEKDSQASVLKIASKNGMQLTIRDIHIIDNTCCTGLTLLTNATQAIKSGKWKNILVCAVDLMDPYGLFTLNEIGAFANADMDPSLASRPFDLQRSGFVKTESASLALVSSEIAELDQSEILKIISFNQTNDGHKITDGREDTKFIKRAMELALTRSGLDASQLAFIKAHGTSTQLNDLHEARAISELFPNNIPVTSLKGHLGHTTDASGLVENIIAGTALKKGLVLPTKNFQQSEISLNIVKASPLVTKKKYFLSNAFGFGGNNISALFEVI